MNMSYKILLNLFRVKKSIQAKIFMALLSVVLLTLISIVPVWYIESSHTIKENALNYAMDSIKRDNENLDIMMQDIDNITAIIARKSDITQALKTHYEKPTYEWFRDLVGIKGFLDALMLFEQTNISGITVVDMKDNLYWAGKVYIPNDVMKTDWVKNILESNGKEVILIREVVGARKIMTFGRAIMQSSAPIGIVFIDIDYQVIKDNFDMDFLEDSFVFVVNRNGDFIYHPDESLVGDNIINTEYYDIYRNRISQNSQHTFVYYESQYTGWTTVGMISRKELEKDIIQMRNQTILISLLVFLVAIFTSIVVSNHITKNLKRLRDTMKSIEKGNLSAIPDIYAEDEVGELSKSFTKMMAKINKLMDDIKEHEKVKREIEFKALQASINPHFLYNTLNTIKYLADGQNIKNISEVTTSLVTLLYTTIGKDSQYITIQEEIEHVRAYLNIQKYKYLNKFTVVFEVEDEVLKCEVLKMMLQPIVENALIHGIEPLEHPGVISIKIYKEEKNIKFKVTDNGVGMSKEQVEQLLKDNHNNKRSRFSGIGIKNVNERIKLFYGRQYGLKIYSELGLYTTVEFEIPMLKKEVGKGA